MYAGGCSRMLKCKSDLPAALAERHQYGQFIMGVLSKPIGEIRQVTQAFNCLLYIIALANSLNSSKIHPKS